MPHFKFDISKLERLNDEGRFEQLDPDRMWSALDLPAARSIVEIGAGTGLFAARFAAMAPEATVYAVDMEPAMIEWMRQNRPEVASGRIIPILSEEAKIPLSDDAADAVVMVNLHHELASPRETYAESLRILAPGGRILVVDWARGDTPKGPPQAVRADPETVVALLRSVGLDRVTVHPALPWHWMVSGQHD